MQKELASCGDKAEISLQANVAGAEILGIAGTYHVVCRDKDGNVKWEEGFPNLVNAVGKELMLDTLLRGSSYSVVGPFLGLIGGSTPTFSASDTNANHPGWTEFTNYTVGGSPIRGTAVFGAASSGGLTPANITTSLATPITYAIIGVGGTISGCFLLTGFGASSTQGDTGGTLYSAGAFATAKVTTAGDTVSVTYSTTATS